MQNAPKPNCIHGPGDAAKCGHPDCAYWKEEMKESQKALQEGDVEKVTGLIIRHAARNAAKRARAGRGVTNG